MENFMGFVAEPFYLVTAFAFIILMMILMLMPQPSGEEWRPFRHSLHYVKIAFGIMTALNIVQCFNRESPPHEYGLLLLIIAYYQALCFTMCFRRLLYPRSSLHLFINHLICVTIGAVIVLGVHFFAPHKLCRVFYWIYLTSYVGMGLYYVHLGRKEWRDCVNRLSNYYDDDMADRMRWLRRLMWTVFGVGVLALITSLWVQFNPLFVVVYTLAYAYFLVCIIRYAFNAKFIVLPMEDETAEKEQTTETEAETSVLPPSEREQQLAAALLRWVEEKQYTKSDVAIEETARQLGTNYSFLSTYFQKHEGTTFRDWRTNLRVEEAKRLLREDASLTISEVIDKSGFNDRANFHRHFTRIVGCSPSAYRAGKQ